LILELTNKRSTAYRLEGVLDVRSLEDFGQKVVDFLVTICADDTGRGVGMGRGNEEAYDIAWSKWFPLGTFNSGKKLYDTVHVGTNGR
jgi:hypothetical protein